MFDLHAARVRAAETHGTGGTFSAAAAALLAGGRALPDAVKQAQAFVAAAMAGSVPVGRHRPLAVSAARL